MFLKSINITLDFMFRTVLDELSLKCVVLPVWKNTPNSPSSQTRQDYCNEWEYERLNFMGMRTTWFFMTGDDFLEKIFKWERVLVGLWERGVSKVRVKPQIFSSVFFCGWNIWNVSSIVKLSRSLSTITLKSTELNWRRYSIICMYRKQKPDQKTLWFDAETSNF